LVIHNNYYINDFEYGDVFTEFVQDVNTDISAILKTPRKILEIDRAVFIKIPFLNAGHAFGNITRAVYKIKHNPLLADYTVIVTQELVDLSPFLLSIITLFFQDVVVVDDNTIINFKSAYIIRDHSLKCETATRYLMNRLKSIIDITDANGICDNICLIKTPITKSGNNNRVFDTDYNDFIKTYGFMIVVPENYTIIEIFRLIYGAKRVIMSWGCCSYLNSVFTHPESNVLILGHEGYKNEYDQFPGDQIFESEWFPVKSRMKLHALYLDSELTQSSKVILDEKIRALFIECRAEEQS
jgi:capsular polysaccharide biosynthesis protein